MATWQILSILGLLFVIGEMFTASFVLLPIGVALLATAALSPLLPDWPAIFAALAVNLTVVFALCKRWVWPRLQQKEQPMNAGGMIGQVVVVTEDIPPGSGSGYVRLYGDRWQAVSERGLPHCVGERVRIQRTDGNKVIVAPLTDAAPAR